MADLSKAVSDLMSRLDAISGRIQAVEAQLASGAGASSSSSSSSSSSGPSSSGPSAGASSPLLAAFDDVVNEHLSAFEATSNIIATPRQKEQVAHFVAAVAALRAVIQVASQSKKPADLGSVPVVKAFFETANKVVAANKGPRKGDVDFNQISALSEAVSGLSWFLWSKGDPNMNGVPAPVVQEGLNGATFYLNPIRVAHKPGGAAENPDQIKWVNQLTEFFKQLQAYVLKHHTQGLVWNPNGGDASAAAVPAAAAAAPAPAAGGPPPPPPPGPPPAVDPAAAEKEAAASAARSNLFAALNKGDGITTGLKKVTKDMQTHKNPELRASSVVPAARPATSSSSSSSSSSSRASSAPARPPVTELQGNKWVIEWHKGNKGITISEAEPKHVLYLYKLEDCVVQVTNPKVNAITIDNCKKLGLVFHNVISGVEIVNSTSLEVQAQGIVPNFAIDKCSSVTLYISKEALGTQFVVSKSDSLNVIVPDGDSGETKELYVPEQFVSVIRDGALVTTTLEHE